WPANASTCNSRMARRSCSTPTRHSPAASTNANTRPGCTRARHSSKSPPNASYRWKSMPDRSAPASAIPASRCVYLDG
ncbi:Iron siderophore sensor protein, partial [Pseudomonas sp. FEN]